VLYPGIGHLAAVSRCVTSPAGYLSSVSENCVL
jgi:hypothetical protein